MNNFFEKFIALISAFGKIREAHLYHYNYISATVSGNDGKTYEFTVNVKEDKDND